ncbi:hypothetical protein SAMN05421760_105239 [Neptunomonas antarctica]|uniref:Uncharacterized protein n=1 Tax=Neptunomonas antarctica TaxID=619304 RepID=A0A1N7M7E5_9GAMM|nr:hypothetical protein SAMN05421760_105239 [Neptunomonas antarctica]
MLKMKPDNNVSGYFFVISFLEVRRHRMVC